MGTDLSFAQVCAYMWRKPSSSSTGSCRCLTAPRETGFCLTPQSGKAESKDGQGQSEDPASQVTARLQHSSTQSPDPLSLSPLPKPQGY